MRDSPRVDPLRVRSLILRKRSLLRKYAETEPFHEELLDSNTTHRYVHFVKPKKKPKGRRCVRFAPLVDVYETVLPESFTAQESGARWVSREDYDNAKKEFAEVILLLQSNQLESADLLLEESEIPHDHVLNRHCLRGCEKYFDLETRFKIRQVIGQKVLSFHREHPDNPEALSIFTRALTAECKDLAFFHGKLNALHCWGRLLQQYQQLQLEVSRVVFTTYTPTIDSFTNEVESSDDGVEVILDPSACTGSRALSELGL